MNTASLLKIFFSPKVSDIKTSKGKSASKQSFEQQLVSSSNMEPSGKVTQRESTKTKSNTAPLTQNNNAETTPIISTSPEKKQTATKDIESVQVSAETKKNGTDGREVASGIVYSTLSNTIAPEKKSLLKTLLHFVTDKKPNESQSTVTKATAETGQLQPQKSATPLGEKSEVPKAATSPNEAKVSTDQRASAPTVVSNQKTPQVENTPRPAAKQESPSEQPLPNDTGKRAESRVSSPSTVSSEKIEAVVRETKVGTITTDSARKTPTTSATNVQNGAMRDKQIQDLWHGMTEPVKQTSTSKPIGLPITETPSKVVPVTESGKQTQSVSNPVPAEMKETKTTTFSVPVTKASEAELSPTKPVPAALPTPMDIPRTETKSFWGMKVATAPKEPVTNQSPRETTAQPTASPKSNPMPSPEGLFPKQNVAATDPVSAKPNPVKAGQAELQSNSLHSNEKTNPNPTVIGTEKPLEKKAIVFDSAKKETPVPVDSVKAGIKTPKSTDDSIQNRVTTARSTDDGRIKSPDISPELSSKMQRNSDVNQPSPSKMQLNSDVNQPSPSKMQLNSDVNQSSPPKMQRNSDVNQSSPPNPPQAALRTNTKNPVPEYVEYVIGKPTAKVAKEDGPVTTLRNSEKPQPVLRNESVPNRENVSGRNTTSENTTTVNTTVRASSVPAAASSQQTQKVESTGTPRASLNSRTVESKADTTIRPERTQPVIVSEQARPATKPAVETKVQREPVSTQSSFIRTENHNPEKTAIPKVTYATAEKTPTLPRMESRETTYRSPVYESPRAQVATATEGRVNRAPEVANYRSTQETRVNPTVVEQVTTKSSQSADKMEPRVSPNTSSVRTQETPQVVQPVVNRSVSEKTRSTNLVSQVVNEKTDIRQDTPVRRENRESTIVTPSAYTQRAHEPTVTVDRTVVTSAKSADISGQQNSKSAQLAATSATMSTTTSASMPKPASTIVAGEVSRSAPAVFVDRTPFATREAANSVAETYPRNSKAVSSEAVVATPVKNEPAARTTTVNRDLSSPAPTVLADRAPVVPREVVNTAPEANGRSIRSAARTTSPEASIVDSTKTAQTLRSPIVVGETPPSLSSVFVDRTPFAPREVGKAATESKAQQTEGRLSSASSKEPPVSQPTTVIGNRTEPKPFTPSSVPSAAENTKIRPAASDDRTVTTNRVTSAATPKESAVPVDPSSPQNIQRPSDARAISFVSNDVVKPIRDYERSGIVDSSSRETAEKTESVKSSSAPAISRSGSTTPGNAISAMNSGQNGSGSTFQKQTSDSSGKPTSHESPSDPQKAGTDFISNVQSSGMAFPLTPPAASTPETATVRHHGKSAETVTATAKATETTTLSQQSHAERLASADPSTAIPAKMNLEASAQTQSVHSTLKFSAEQIRELQELVARATLSSSSMGGATPEAQFNWTSPELGTLKFHISTKDSDVSVQIYSNNQDVVDTLEQSKAVVERLFTDQGLRIERFDIHCRNDASTQTNGGEHHFDGRSTSREQNAERSAQSFSGTASTSVPEEPQPERRAFTGKREWVA